MKKQILMALVVVCTTTFIYAQSIVETSKAAQGTGQRAQLTPEERSRRFADKVNSTVQLSPEQYQRVMDLNMELINQRKAAKAVQGKSNGNNHDEFKAMIQQRNEKLKSILTSEQWQKWQLAMEQKRAEMRKGGIMK